MTNTLAPVWTGGGQAVLQVAASTLMAGNWTATVVDCEGLYCGTSETICSPTGQVLTEADLQSGSFNFSSVAGCDSLTLGLTCAQ